jgi:lipopolysaccharide transport system permease protein
VLIDRVVAVFTSFRHHHQVILQLTRRDVVGRYRGSIGGPCSRLNPRLRPALHSFLCGVVFRARWDTAVVARRLA